MTPPASPPDEDLARLSTLAREGGIVAPVLLRVQADLFAAARRRDPATVEAFADLALRLVPQVDADTAAQVARRVAVLPETPDALLAALSARGGEAARLVEALAPRPLGVAASAEPLVALARARREDLGPDEIERLVARLDPAIDRAIAENHALVLQGRARGDLLQRARESGASARALAAALLGRDDLSADEAAALYTHADAAARGMILMRLATETRPATRPIARARPAREARIALLAASDRGDKRLFGSRLAALLGLDATPDWRFEEPGRTDLLAFALLGAGLAEEDAIRVFLTLDPTIARSVETVFRLVRLTRTTPRSIALRVLEATTGTVVRGAAARGRHVPVFAAAERRRGGFTALLGRRDDERPTEGREETMVRKDGKAS